MDKNTARPSPLTPLYRPRHHRRELFHLPKTPQGVHCRPEPNTPFLASAAAPASLAPATCHTPPLRFQSRGPTLAYLDARLRRRDQHPQLRRPRRLRAASSPCRTARGTSRRTSGRLERCTLVTRALRRRSETRARELLAPQGRSAGRAGVRNVFGTCAGAGAVEGVVCEAARVCDGADAGVCADSAGDTRDVVLRGCGYGSGGC